MARSRRPPAPRTQVGARGRWVARTRRPPTPPFGCTRRIEACGWRQRDAHTRLRGRQRGRQTGERRTHRGRGGRRPIARPQGLHRPRPSDVRAPLPSQLARAPKFREARPCTVLDRAAHMSLVLAGECRRVGRKRAERRWGRASALPEELPCRLRRVAPPAWRTGRVGCAIACLLDLGRRWATLA